MLPRHLELSRSQRAFSAISIAAALALFGLCAARIATEVHLTQWWVPLALLGGMAAADFGSGIVHWFADTWGRDDLPVIGRRLLVPFRLHHVNPDDLLERPFIDCNGDVAFVTLPVLLGLLAVPLTAPWGGPLAIFLFALCGIGMMTNQIHQWAHMPSPPRLVRLIQQCGLFLGHAAHADHHDSPYDANYCITTGWCNRPLEAIGFFRRLERAITRVTGAQPRQDDRRYEAAHAAAGALTRAAGLADEATGPADGATRPWTGYWPESWWSRASARDDAARAEARALRTIHDQSARSARVGSTREARHAGKAPTSRPVARTRTEAMISVFGSRAERP